MLLARPAFSATRALALRLRAFLCQAGLGTDVLPPDVVVARERCFAKHLGYGLGQNPVMMMMMTMMMMIMN